MSRSDEPLPPEFSAQDVATLRQGLKLSQKDLALKLGVETSLVVAWEKGTAFPTLDNARKLLALREGRPLETRGRRVQTDPLKGLLSDPEFWGVFRKLLGHRELWEQVRKIARSYPDPASPGDKPRDGAP
jgi:transcriptional regulator with XRE-family HTH domain